MPDYKMMYFQLAAKVADAMDILLRAHDHKYEESLEDCRCLQAVLQGFLNVTQENCVTFVKTINNLFK